MKKIYMTAISIILPLVASARIVNVPADYPTIQEGIDVAQNGDTVLVAPGLYTETVTIENKNILLTSSEGPEDTEIKGFVIFQEGVDTTCILRGFTVIPDPDDPWYDARSLISIEYGAPIIEGNIVIDGHALYASGGGISTLHSDAIIRGNIVRDNQAYYGGGISLGGGTAIVEKNIIANNHAPFFHGPTGGGISLSSGIIRYNLIIDNEVRGNVDFAVGGGIEAHFPIDTLIRHIYNNTLANNSARIGQFQGKGGGIYFGARSDQNENVFYKNNIIAFNPYGGGVYVNLIDYVQIDWDYNLVYGNDSANYIGIEPGPHDIQADPLFVDRFSGDYHLLPNSPCIDAGDPDFPLDPDSTRADIGAYYFDQTVGIDDPREPSGPYRFQLHQNYPNPFNSQTIISYYLSEESVVSLHIYSITGHFVTAIASKETQASGEHKYVWDGKDKNGKMVSTGIYFYELYVDAYRESKAMIIIK